jgi:7,8-dihydroneopterin aldolase/epimerase/oxygenase
MNADWTLRIDRKLIDLAVGIYPYEIGPQPVLVSIEVQGEAAADPSNLEDCLDYEPLNIWLHHDWPKSPHVPLLETRINQVFDFVFEADPRVTSVRVGLYKKRMALGAQAVGIERSMTRLQYRQRRAALSAQRDCGELVAACAS